MSTEPAAPVRLQPSEQLNELEAEHRAWLAPFHPQHLTNFDKLRDADYEAAMTEAGVRRFLQSHGVSVTPSADLTDQPAPDFLCDKDGYKFYVEVTNVSIGTATQTTGLQHIEPDGTRCYSSLTDALWGACRRKASQCGSVELPALVAVGTFHGEASMICIQPPHLNELLTGVTSITYNVDLSDEADPDFDHDVHQTTELYSAAFVRRDPTDGLAFARSSVAGLLVCGSFEIPLTVLGLLHPNATRPFDRSVLPGVAFGELVIDRDAKQLSTRWTGLPKAPDVEFDEAGDDA